MGIVNVTPDSFSDGGRYLSKHDAIAHGEALAEAGADLLDLGGESTRPGSRSVSVTEEQDRVVPVIEALARRVDLPLSVDTTKSEVAQAAFLAGATIVNDTSAGWDDPRLLPLIAEQGLGVVLMHRRGTPRTMQDAPQYQDCVAEVCSELGEALRRALAAGIREPQIVVDPGIGFGKRLEDNLALIRGLADLRQLGFPILLGVSRKSFLGQLTGKTAAERDPASHAVHVWAASRGVEILRVHDVAGTRDALSVVAALDEE